MENKAKIKAYCDKRRNAKLEIVLSFDNIANHCKSFVVKAAW